MNSKRLLAMAVATAIAAPMSAFATNGMNMEGYGPIATGMGGASMAYDNGTAAMANNPATIGLMPEGNRIDVAFGSLVPSVTSENVNGNVSSDGGPYNMPAFGWTKRAGKLGYGVGMFAQGGMGAEYKGGSAVDQTGTAGVPFSSLMMPGMTNSDSQTQRSELGVGRLIFPITYNVNNRLTIGGSIDYVWGGLDILWSMDARNFLGAMSPGAGADATKSAVLGGAVGSQNTRATASGSLIDTFINSFDTSMTPGDDTDNNGAFGNFYWGTFKFSDDNDFTQETKGDGFAAKLGVTYKMTDKLTLGASYHPETSMSDFEGDITMTFKVDLVNCVAAVCGQDITAAMGQEIDVAGTVKVKDFQWPSTLGLGLAYQASDKLMVVADWKRLNWSEVMKDFHMVITADDTQVGLAQGFAGTVLDFTYPQNWNDQSIIQLGASYAATKDLTVRWGVNRASNPVPDGYVNHLFPATIEQHYTAGFGYSIDNTSSIDFSMTHAPNVTVTESQTETNNLGTTPATTITHSQNNWQIMYSKRF